MFLLAAAPCPLLLLDLARLLAEPLRCHDMSLHIREATWGRAPFWLSGSATCMCPTLSLDGVKMRMKNNLKRCASDITNLTISPCSSRSHRISSRLSSRIWIPPPTMKLHMGAETEVSEAETEGSLPCQSPHILMTSDCVARTYDNGRGPAMYSKSLAGPARTLRACRACSP